jgi:hypothetical protein
MKLIKSNLLSNVVGSYDQTKTTIQGRVSQKTLGGSDYLGPPLTKFNDLFTDVGFAPLGTLYKTSNNRIYQPFLVIAGTIGIALYNHNDSTNVNTYVGQIRFNISNLAATVHTLRGLKVIDTGTTGYKIFFSTVGSVLINGGTMLVNNVDLADFTPIPGAVIPFASGNNQKAVYFLQDSSTLGAAHLNTATAGTVLDSANNRLYIHNGIAATHQYYVFDTSATPTYTTAAITGTELTNTINNAGHTFIAGDQIRFDSLVGGAGLTNGTVYFVRAPVAGVSYELAATTGGAAINFTTDITSGNVGRAFGITGSNFLHKTGNLPALTGTLILLDSEDYAVPSHTPNAGFPCVFFATTTNLYLGRLSELTVGTTTWASSVTSNILGTANQITTPTTITAAWSDVLDAAVYVTNGSKFVIKKVINNQILQIFGRLNNMYYEGFASPEATAFAQLTITGLDFDNGKLFCNSTTVGQRGFMSIDLRSDSSYDYSYIVTPVLNTPSAVYEVLSSTEYRAITETGGTVIYYRTSGFGSISGGWTIVPSFSNMSGLAAGSQVQFKILFQLQSSSFSTPTHIKELYLGFSTLSEISDNWEFSDDWSDNTSPSRTAFRLKTTYVGAVPTLYYRAYDLSDALLINNNTVSNAANFEYSTDNGTSWLPLGTIPNTVGTLVRYTFTSPPGVDIRPSLRES